MSLDLTIYLTKEGRHYVAHAMPLDVVSSGSTPEEAGEAVYEAVRAFLLTAADAGTLEEVLEDCGYERRGDHWVCPEADAVPHRSSYTATGSSCGNAGASPHLQRHTATPPLYRVSSSLR